jgi:hypothetical protein
MQSDLQKGRFLQNPLKERIKNLKRRLGPFHQNCFMVMKMRKLLTLKRTELYW